MLFNTIYYTTFTFILHVNHISIFDNSYKIEHYHVHMLKKDISNSGMLLTWYCSHNAYVENEKACSYYMNI